MVLPPPPPPLKTGGGAPAPRGAHNPRPWLRYRSRLDVKAAEIGLAEAVRQDASGGALWHKMHDEAAAAAARAVDALSRLGGGPLLVQALLVQARARPPLLL